MNLASAEERILRLISAKGKIRSRELVRDLGISRQAVHKHLQSLEQKKCIEQHGAARAVYYTASRASEEARECSSIRPTAPPKREHGLPPTFSRKVLKIFGATASLTSRLEARRMLDRLKASAELVIDFDRIERVGAGFADEIFRVWAKANPQTTLIPVNMPTIQRAITKLMTGSP